MVPDALWLDRQEAQATLGRDRSLVSDFIDSHDLLREPCFPKELLKALSLVALRAALQMVGIGNHSRPCCFRSEKCPISNQRSDVGKHSALAEQQELNGTAE